MTFRRCMPEWISNALLLILAVGVAYVMWALASENRELKSEIAQLRAQSSSLGPSLQRGDPLPTVLLADLAGRSASLSALVPRGGVITFLTTTCPFCKQTLPAWARIAEAYAANGVPFVSVSLDDAERTRSYVAELGISWPLWLPDDPATASAELQVSQVPLTILVGPDSAVERAWIGALVEADVDALLDLLDHQFLTTSALSGSLGEDPGCCKASAVGTAAGS